MNNEQFYIHELSKKAAIIFSQNSPAAGPNSVSQFARMQSYMTDIPVKLKAINDQFVLESNKLLEEASKNNSIDTNKLKDDFTTVFKTHYNEWLQKHKPK